MGDDSLQLAPEPNKKIKKKLHAHLNGTPPPPPPPQHCCSKRENLNALEKERKKSPKDMQRYIYVFTRS